MSGQVRTRLRCFTPGKSALGIFRHRLDGRYEKKSIYPTENGTVGFPANVLVAIAARAWRHYLIIRRISENKTII
jgi:hypothetical protein